MLLVVAVFFAGFFVGATAFALYAHKALIEAHKISEDLWRSLLLLKSTAVASVEKIKKEG